MQEGHECTDRTHQIERPPKPKWLQPLPQGLFQGQSRVPRAWQANRLVRVESLQGDSHRLLRYGCAFFGCAPGFRWPSVSERLRGCQYQSPAIDANQRGLQSVARTVRTGCLSVSPLDL